jgi:xanthine dehydrogenase YagS FAD-binding subunit
LGPFAFAAAPGAAAAIAHAATTRGAQFIAGGTDLMQLLQEGVAAPETLIDINRLPLGGIAMGRDGVRIGALARMAEVADDPRIREHFPAVAEALLASASPQVRNMATIGGNLLQRTRCLYFRDATTPCNKRHPGSGCPAQDGENRMNAVLGGSEHCIAAYPGDLAVALVALAATVVVSGTAGERIIPLESLHRVPDGAPERDTVLEPGDLITAVVIPATPFARRSHYVKLRDRASFEWALASAAVAFAIEDGIIRQARVAVGGVAVKPWRLPDVEAALVGERAGASLFHRAASLAGNGAAPRPGNEFKVELVRRVVERALLAAGASP